MPVLASHHFTKIYIYIVINILGVFFQLGGTGHKRDWCQKAMQVSTRFGQAREFYKGFQFL
jgi:hypothetical protein